MRQRDVFSAVDIRFSDRHLCRIDFECNLLCQSFKRMRVQELVCAPCSLEVNIVNQSLSPDVKGQHYGAVTPFGCTGIEKGDVLWRHHVVNALTVIGDEG